MNSQNFETILARLYTDSDFLCQFLKDPQTTLKESNLNIQQIQELVKIDKAGLILAHRSFKRKREGYVAMKKSKS